MLNRIALVFFGGFILVWCFLRMHHTEYPTGFDINSFRSIAIGSSIENAYREVGTPFYGWRSFVSAHMQQEPVLPLKRDTLERDQIIGHNFEGVRLTMFYSRPKYSFIPFTKHMIFYLRFESGILVERAEVSYSE